MRIIIYTAVFLLVLLQSMILTEIHRINNIEVAIPEYQSKNKVLGIQITRAIIEVETGGKSVKGKSGESGVAQFLPSTWNAYVKKYMATTTLPLTPENEFEVLTRHNTYMLDKGYTPYQTILVHNQGSTGKCRRGTNKYGVKYDSCAYAQKVLAMVK